MRTTQVNFCDIENGQIFFFRNFDGVCVKYGANKFLNNHVLYTMDNVKALCIVYTVAC